MADEVRAAHSVGMAGPNGAAVHVEPLVRDADAVAAVDHLDREGFVQLPQVDVAGVLAGVLEQLRHREHRADSHLARVAAGDGEAAEDPERGESPAARFALAPDAGGPGAARKPGP